MNKLFVMLFVALLALPAFADEVTGTLTILHSDNFQTGRSTRQWVVHDDNGRDHKVEVTRDHERQLGKKVRVKGNRRVDGTIKADQVDPLSSQLVLAVTGGTNVLFVLINFSDTPNPYTQAEVQTSASLLTGFYAEASYGVQTLNITVTRPLTIPIARAAGCGNDAVGAAADAAASAGGYNVSSFSYRFYVMPTAPCGWTGSAYVGVGRAWSNGSNAPLVYSHELGHNFGLLHSGRVPVVGPGQAASEYGDTYSPMGNAAMHHYVSAQKAIMSWLTAGQTATAAGGTQNYTLSPLEVAGGALYQVRIPTPNGSRTYALEYRKPIGFDNALCFNSSCVGAVPEGVFVHLLPPFESVSGDDDTQLVFSLLPGDSYTDPEYPISVSYISTSAAGAVVRVSNDTAPPPPPPPPSSNAIINGDFEIPSLASGAYQYGPSGATWVFASAGLQSNGSAFGAAAAPDGRQTAFIQGPSGTISQTLTLDAGSYLLSFKLAGRPCCVAPYIQPIKVTLDGMQIGIIATPPSTAFTDFSTSFTVAATGSHTIAFAGTADGDRTTFLDAVTLTGGSPPQGPTPTTTALGVVTTYTATVTGSNPTGTVRFGTIATCQAVPLVSGSASCTAPFVSGIVASYSGDANNAPSQSP